MLIVYCSIIPDRTPDCRYLPVRSTDFPLLIIPIPPEPKAGGLKKKGGGGVQKDAFYDNPNVRTGSKDVRERAKKKKYSKTNLAGPYKTIPTD